MFLTTDELRTLTRRKQSVAQRRVLDALGVRYGMRPDGSLVVSVSAVERQLGGAPSSAGAVREPKWEAMNA